MCSIIIEAYRRYLAHGFSLPQEVTIARTKLSVRRKSKRTRLQRQLKFKAIRILLCGRAKSVPIQAQVSAFRIYPARRVRRKGCGAAGSGPWPCSSAASLCGSQGKIGSCGQFPRIKSRAAGPPRRARGERATRRGRRARVRGPPPTRARAIGGGEPELRRGLRGPRGRQMGAAALGVSRPRAPPARARCMGRRREARPQELRRSRARGPLLAQYARF